MSDQPKRKTTEIPEAVHKRFKKACVEREIPMNEATEQAIDLWIKNKPGKKELQSA